jgi:hypothetical protein
MTIYEQQLEDENAKLREMLAETQLELDTLKLPVFMNQYSGSVSIGSRLSSLYPNTTMYSTTNIASSTIAPSPLSLSPDTWHYISSKIQTKDMEFLIAQRIAAEESQGETKWQKIKRLTKHLLGIRKNLKKE